MYGSRDLGEMKNENDALKVHQALLSTTSQIPQSEFMNIC